MNAPVPLYVSVPVTSLRVPQSREYLESFPCPAPSTVYGMLLSTVGENDRLAYEGAELAVAVLDPMPVKSLVLRTLWHIKNKKVPPGLLENRRPDFQELLTGLKLAVWVRKGSGEMAEPSLEQRLHGVIRQPSSANRFGGLALGESTHLVDELRPWRNEDGTVGHILIGSPAGDLTLPIWPDHVGSRYTRWGQYSLERHTVIEPPPPEAWVDISRS